MNIQRKHTIPPVHGANEIPNNDELVETYCGQWVSVDNFGYSANSEERVNGHTK